MESLSCVTGGVSIRGGGSGCCLVMCMCVHGLQDGRAIIIIIMITYVFVSVTSVCMFVYLCYYICVWIGWQTRYIKEIQTNCHITCACVCVCRCVCIENYVIDSLYVCILFYVNGLKLACRRINFQASTNVYNNKIYI